VDLDRGQQGLIETQIDGVELALAGSELAVGGEDPGDVGGVIFVVGSVVELDQVAVFEFCRRFVIVRVIRVFSGGYQREVGGAVGAVFLEDEFGVGLEFVFVHAGAGVTHGFDDAEAGDAGGFADNGDFARGLDGSHLVEDGVEVADFGGWRRGFEFGDKNFFAGLAAVPGVVFGGFG
jgi:hypothetical protein